MVKHHRSTLCYHCGIASEENVFKYYNNGKPTQPRYQCGNCQKFFTVGSHGRPEGKMYKERNVDPPELKGLRRECRCCGVADNAPFKYYNNSNLAQPRFKCLNCGQQFQMRLTGVGEERRLVHTSSSSYQSDRGKFDDGVDISEKMQMPGVELFPTSLSDEDAKYLDLIEAGLKNEKEAPPPAAVLRLQLWASKLPRNCHQSGMPLNPIRGPLASAEV